LNAPGGQLNIQQPQNGYTQQDQHQPGHCRQQGRFGVSDFFRIISGGHIFDGAESKHGQGKGADNGIADINDGLDKIAKAAETLFKES